MATDLSWSESTSEQKCIVYYCSGYFQTVLFLAFQKVLILGKSSIVNPIFFLLGYLARGGGRWKGGHDGVRIYLGRCFGDIVPSYHFHLKGTIFPPAPQIEWINLVTI